MNREKIISLATDHGCHFPLRSGFGDCRVPQFFSADDLVKFYHAVRNEALEDAAKECDLIRAGAFPVDCAAAIRVLKETK